MVVDDNADLRRYVRSVLTPEFAVEEAANGREGLRVAREHLTEPDFSVDDLAERLAMSRSTLYRTLKGACGTTPPALVTEVRMAEAKRLLASGEPATQVAYAVGYETLAAFSSAFDEHVGRPPVATPPPRTADGRACGRDCMWR